MWFNFFFQVERVAPFDRLKYKSGHQTNGSNNVANKALYSGAK